jgi:ATP-dependent RNA helicase RhlE
MSDDVFKSAAQIMRDPLVVTVGGGGGPASRITHRMHHVRADDKAAWLMTFLRRTGGSTLVFTRTKRGAERLGRRLASSGAQCVAIHGDLTQAQRMQAMEGFRAGRFTTLVATDIAARGLDIDGISHVINFDVPDTADSYVHRVGRTARAEAAGTALTLVAHEEEETLRAIERSLKIRFQDSRPA